MRNRVHAFRRVEGSGLYTNECTVIHESKEEEVSREREREEGKGRGIRKEATSEPAVTVISAPTAKPPLEFTSIYD